MTKTSNEKRFAINKTSGCYNLTDSRGISPTNGGGGKAIESMEEMEL